ncbi:unnamed protein product [Prunus armeniaca]|uniref:Uncharacterized protein n=1 Tax=Prunus armeniaca TaxID=36596 RepID=A0A6J5VL19_PRUAR|nr:unnamed protein product [Prunus armeniaca]
MALLIGKRMRPIRAGWIQSWGLWLFLGYALVISMICFGILRREVEEGWTTTGEDIYRNF